MNPPVEAPISSAVSPCDRDLEVIERAFEFQSAAADVARRRLKRHGRSGFDQDRGLAGNLIADSYFAGHDGALRLLAARANPLLHQENIQTRPFWFRHLRRHRFLANLSDRRPEGSNRLSQLRRRDAVGRHQDDHVTDRPG